MNKMNYFLAGIAFLFLQITSGCTGENINNLQATNPNSAKNEVVKNTKYSLFVDIDTNGHQEIINGYLSQIDSIILDKDIKLTPEQEYELNILKIEMQDLYKKVLTGEGTREDYQKTLENISKITKTKFYYPQQ